MKQNTITDKSTLKWWGIFALCLASSTLFIIQEYKNAAQNFSSQNMDPESLGQIIFHSAIAIIISLSVLALAWRPVAIEKTNAEIKENPDQFWLKNNLPFGVALWCESGNLVSCNNLYKDKLDLDSNNKFYGNTYVEMMKKVKLNNNLKITNDEEMLRQIEITHENGASSLIDERPLSNGGFITMIFDISEKVKAQNELKKVQYRQRQMAKEIEREKIKAEAASRSKTSFLAHLSHDVRTPLNHIIGFSDLISHQTFGPIGDDRYLKYINDIKSSGEKLLESFSEILELAQLEGGDLILKLEDIELEKTLQATINRFKDSAKRAGIKLELNVPQDMIFHTDKLCVERMLNNIIENSIRFTPKGGAIKISSWLADDGVVFEISDTGIGISAERLLDLDQPFVLGDAAFTREGGVGLGIAISRAIAQLNGGQLAIDSTPALGTTVVISLPTDLSEKSALSNVA